MKILVTGAAGYVGRRLVARLLGRGDHVVALVRDPAKIPAVPAGTPGRLTVVPGDLASDAARRQVVDAVRAAGLPALDACVHLAALLDYDAPEAKLFAINRDGARRAAEIATDLGVKTAILMSSLAAAGPCAPEEIPGLVDLAERPDTTYGKSKLAGEHAFAAVVRAAGLKPVILRPGNILGDGTLGFLEPFFAALRTVGPAPFLAEFQNRRFQPVHVDDVVTAVVAALEHGGDGVYNLTDGTKPIVRDLLRHAVYLAIGYGFRIPWVDESKAPPARTDRVHYAYGIERTVSELRWRPQRNFPSMLIDEYDRAGFVRSRDDVPIMPGPLNVILCNTPSPDMGINRDMGGGYGFVHAGEDRFPQLDLLWLAAHLQKVGWPVRCVDGAITPFAASDFLHFMAENNVDLVVCEVNLPTFEHDVEFLRRLRYNSRARVVAKTALVHPQFHRRLLEEASVAFVITGECDLTIDRVLTGEDARGTVRFVKGEVTTVPEVKLENLDLLPLPARRLIAKEDYRYELLGGGDFTTIQSSRGCPYSCGYYCPYPLTQGKAWRARSAAHVVAEIEDCVSLGYRRFLFRDATFTLNRKRTADICDLIVAKGIKIDFWCETRFNCLDEELLFLMAKAGCRGINFGLESGDDEVLQAGAKQGVDVKKIRSILKATHAAGIASHLLVIVGLPQETRKTIFETYRLLAELPARTIGVTTVTPMPGTDLWYDAEKNDWIRSKEWANYGGNQTVMVTDHLSMEDIRFAWGMLFEYFQLTRHDSGATPAAIAAHQARMADWVERGLPAAV